MGMLKDQDIFVRSHLSPLKPEQVACMRARWEREKRKQKDATPTKHSRQAIEVTPAGTLSTAGDEAQASPLPKDATGATHFSSASALPHVPGRESRVSNTDLIIEVARRVGFALKPAIQNTAF